MVGLAALQQGNLIHGYILKRGFDSILPILGTLMIMYGRCGEISMEQRVLDIYISLISRRPFKTKYANCENIDYGY